MGQNKKWIFGIGLLLLSIVIAFNISCLDSGESGGLNGEEQA